MNRRTFIGTLAALPVVAARQVQAQTPEPELATEKVAKQAVKKVNTFIKRATSKKEEVRLQAWAMLTPEMQGYFANDPAQMVYADTTVYSIKKEVAVEPSGHLGVVVNLSGFINEHGLYTKKFLLTQGDFLIADQMDLPEVSVPKGMKATKVTTVATDTEIRVNRAEFDNKEVVIITVRNDGTAPHTLQVFRMNDGQTVDTLVQLVAAVQPSMDVAESYGVAPFVMPDNSRQIGIMDAEPGTYVVIGTTLGDSLMGIYAQFTLTE